MFDSIKKIFGGKNEKDSIQNSAHRDVSTTENSGSVEILENAAAALGTAIDESAAGGVSSSANIRAQSPLDITALDLPLPTPTELKLEALFQHAAHETSKRNDFLNALMSAELFVVGQTEAGENGATNIQLATQQAGDEPVALAFTSLSAMAQAGAPSSQGFVKIKTVDLLRMIRSQLGFVLNPGNRVAKHFNKWEVEQLTGGGAADSSVREMPMPDNSAVSIGQPAQYPSGLREALARAASEIELITDIHTGLMAVNETKAPILLAVISTQRELGREEFLSLINSLGQHLQNSGAVPLNFAPMNPNFQSLVEQRALVSATELLS